MTAQALILALTVLGWSAGPRQGLAEETAGARSPAVHTVSGDELRKLITERRGDVVLVNFWATWCAPCVEEFPDLLKLRTFYRDRGLSVIFVSIDNPKRSRRDVDPFLRKMKVDFETYIKESGDDEPFINSVSPEWSGAIPATFIYDRTGVLRHQLVDAQTYDEFATKVSPLLQKK